ncbi:putative serine/threonine/dual specificity protein kinase, catalytic domain-containing protein [Tanacetum coccineum]|uniref:Serine/threonine/dual specificity protein kinase, catalytic domain-containing protein n=1 Tax=Tanacetum coccineum TaxID=301880 RepID=A0ABQ4YPQ2_9ASTR
MPFSSEHPCRRFSLAEIQLATNNFDPETIIGKGGFGKVYKDQDIIDLNMTVKCLQTRPKDRPTMSEVVVDLEAALALQERGEYLVRSRYNNGEQISSSSYSKTGKIMTLSRMLRKILPAKTPVRPGRIVAWKEEKQQRWLSKKVIPSKSGAGFQEVEDCGLKKFSLDNLKVVTRNFSDDMVVGEEAFGKVFKVHSLLWTISTSNSDCSSCCDNDFKRVHTDVSWTPRLSNLVIFVLIILDIVVYKLRKLHEKSIPFSSEHPCRRFSLAEIQLATNNFDPETIIGKGGFGKVYKGFIDDGGTKTTVAIKRLDCLSRQGASEFWTEVKMLSRVRHGHLVSLIGYCSEFNEMMVVYEYISGGDLAKRLHKVDGKSIRTPLSWVERLKICIGAARALDYLHTGTGVKNRIIHRDVKSSNILLDENMAAKVSDLGLSKIGPVDQSCTHVSTNVKGTFGYLDPNYFMTGRLTRKSDVYSFGVVLLEVLCGRPAVDPSLDERGLVGWAQRNIKEGTLNDIIDLNMTGLTLCSRKKIQIIKAFVKIAVKCLQTRPKDRPTMSEVVVDLEAALALQERGEYLVRSRYNNGEQISSSSYSKTGKIMMLSRTLRKILPAKTPVRPDVKDGSSHGKKKNNKDGCLKKFYRTKVERVSKKLKIVV